MPAFPGLVHPQPAIRRRAGRADPLAGGPAADPHRLPLAGVVVDSSHREGSDADAVFDRGGLGQLPHRRDRVGAHAAPPAGCAAGAGSASTCPLTAGTGPATNASSCLMVWSETQPARTRR